MSTMPFRGPYVLADRAWNLVAACARCNRQKSDQVAPAPGVELLIARNIRLLQASIGQPLAPAEFMRDFDELRDRDVRDHMVALVNTARQDGFNEWSGPMVQDPTADGTDAVGTPLI